MFIDAYNEQMKPHEEENNGVRMATQADIANIPL